MTLSQRISITLPCAVILACSAFANGAEQEEKENEQSIVARVFKNRNGDTMPCRIYKPANYDPKTRYPLVLCLHGAGGRGDDNKSRGTHAFAALSSPSMQKQYPAFLLTPQCPKDSGWVNTSHKGSYSVSRTPISKQMALVQEILLSVVTKFSIDPARIYVTGQSMGGFGTWDIIMRNPKLFAAAVPICGGADPSQSIRIAHLPIWVFHGEKDHIVPAKGSREMVEALKKAGSKVVKYTEYPGVGHACWGPAWREKELIPWLFEQRNKFAAGGGKKPSRPIRRR